VDVQQWPVVMDKFDRIFELHHCLVGRRTPLLVSEIQDQLQCGRATVYRLLDLMRDRLGAPVVRDAATGGFLYDRKVSPASYELPGLWFTAEELQALVVFQRLLNGLEPGLLDAHLAPLGRRIEQLVASRHLNLGGIEQRIRILGVAARSVGEAFRLVASATLQRRKLRFEYQLRSKDQHTERVVSPQRLIHYRDNWYLDAWDSAKSALRSFSIDRISNAVVCADLAENISEKELDEELATAYGIFSGKANKLAILRFSAERARWVADERWHPDQSGQFLTDGRYELLIPYRDGRELVMDILRHGPHVEVVGPAELRQHAIDIMRQAAQQYEA
jgi:proteasome accessory factor C